MKSKKEKPTPDFLMIPYQLVADKNLNPVDRMVYGAVYWYAGFTKGCIASNKAISEVANTTPNSVSRSLALLEQNRYVLIRYKDKEKKKRIEIIPLVVFSKIQAARYSKANNLAPIGLIVGELPPIHTGITGYSQENNVENPEENPDNGSTEPLNEEKDPVGVIHSGLEIEKYSKRVIKKELLENPLVDASRPNTVSDSSDSMAIKTDGSTEDSAAGAQVPSEGALVNDAIALFLPIMPGDFIGARTAFAKKPTREAVAALMKRYTIAQLKDLIQKYDAGKTDQYRPQVGTVYEFCTLKLSKIEAFVAKRSNQGVYAQKAVSSPEHGKRFGDLVQKQALERREKIKKAKEDWEREHPTKEN